MKNGLALLIASLMLTAHADARPDQRRERRQEARIQQGVQSGELTKREARRLEAEQKHIDNVQERVGADGAVTPAEQRRLNRKQNRMNRDIYRQKHDAQKGPSADVPQGQTPAQEQ